MSANVILSFWNELDVIDERRADVVVLQAFRDELEKIAIARDAVIRGFATTAQKLVGTTARTPGGGRALLEFLKQQRIQRRVTRGFSPLERRVEGMSDSLLAATVGRGGGAVAARQAYGSMGGLFRAAKGKGRGVKLPVRGASPVTAVAPVTRMPAVRAAEARSSRQAVHAGALSPQQAWPKGYRPSLSQSVEFGHGFGQTVRRPMAAPTVSPVRPLVRAPTMSPIEAAQQAARARRRVPTGAPVVAGT